MAFLTGPLSPLMRLCNSAVRVERRGWTTVIFTSVAWIPTQNCCCGFLYWPLAIFICNLVREAFDILLFMKRAHYEFSQFIWRISIVELRIITTRKTVLWSRISSICWRTTSNRFFANCLVQRIRLLLMNNFITKLLSDVLYLRLSTYTLRCILSFAIS
jgi:hypothetical protein